MLKRLFCSYVIILYIYIFYSATKIQILITSDSLSLDLENRTHTYLTNVQQNTHNFNFQLFFCYYHSPSKGTVANASLNFLQSYASFLIREFYRFTLEQKNAPRNWLSLLIVFSFSEHYLVLFLESFTPPSRKWKPISQSIFLVIQLWCCIYQETLNTLPYRSYILLFLAKALFRWIWLQR